MKRFLEWIGLKEKIHNSDHQPPFFKEGEIWWCHTGENIGTETNGKGDKFTRPILIIKKYSRTSFLGLPLTTKMKTGNWYVTIHFYKTLQTINLAQGRALDYKRLKELAGTIRDNSLKEVREAYAKLHSFCL